MNNHHPAGAEHTPDTAGGTDANRYAITLDDMVAGAQVPVADQLVEQPAAPPHDYASGFDTTGNDGDGQGDARGY